jgi:hypothetical protein
MEITPSNGVNMPLFNALSGNNNAVIRLMTMTTIPTTEDLLYALATAKQNKKPVELPFKNISNNLNFIVRVVPGAPGTPQIHPRWHFERVDGGGKNGGNTHLWMRESSEVMMVQGKIKIEANYTGQPAPIVDEDYLPYINQNNNALANPFMSAANLPAMSHIQDLEPTPEAADGPDWKATSGDGTLTSSGTWLFTPGTNGPLMMPPPAVIHHDVYKNYIKALSNPETEFMRHSAFEFFLLRDSKYAKTYGTKLSLLIFDFSCGKKGKTLTLSLPVKNALSSVLQQICGPLELCAQLRSGEFAIALNGYDAARALKFAEKICNGLEDGPHSLENCRELKNLAIGIACLPETCGDPGTLISAASRAKEMAREAEQHYMQFPQL